MGKQIKLSQAEPTNKEKRRSNQMTTDTKQKPTKRRDLKQTTRGAKRATQSSLRPWKKEEEKYKKKVERQPLARRRKEAQLSNIAEDTKGRKEQRNIPKT